MILEKIKKPNDIHKIPLEDFSAGRRNTKHFDLNPSAGQEDIWHPILEW